jgi:hypothetical protein
VEKSEHFAASEESQLFRVVVKIPGNLEILTSMQDLAAVWGLGGGGGEYFRDNL